jgi:exosortase E/protease (VPEID-CTERM system)
LLLPIGIIAIWAANAVRIAMLVAIGSSVSPAVALGGFHSQAGWLAFNAVTLGLVAAAWNSPFFMKASASSLSGNSIAENRVAPYVVPFLVLVATGMLTKAFSSGGVDAFYFIRVVTAAGALIYFWNTYRERDILQWNWSLHAVANGAAVFAVWILMEAIVGNSAGPARAEHAAGLANMSALGSTAWIALRIVGSVLVVPIAEELAFRGYLMRRLQTAEFEQLPMGTFSWFAFIASSVCFGALHGRWIAATIAGMAYALVLCRRGRLSEAVLAHATTNALIAVQVLYIGDWSLWS